MDKGLQGRWLSFRVSAAGKKTTRAQNLLVKVISRHVVLVANKVNGKWQTQSRPANVEENKIVSNNKCLFYILDVSENTIKLFSQDSWTVYEMDRQMEQD